MIWCIEKVYGGASITLTECSGTVWALNVNWTSIMI